MPASIKIIQTQDFIPAQPDGTLDLHASRKLLRDIASELDKAGGHHVLIDTRAVDVSLTMGEIFEVASAFVEERELARQRVGLLVPPEESVNARFFETVSRNRGAELRVFTDFETAISWLIMKEQAHNSRQKKLPF